MADDDHPAPAPTPPDETPPAVASEGSVPAENPQADAPVPATAEGSVPAGNSQASAPAPEPAPAPAPEAATSPAPESPARAFDVEGPPPPEGPPPAPPPTYPPAGPSPDAPSPRRTSPLVFGLLFAARHWRALLLILGVQLLFGLSIALPFRARIGDRLDHHVRAAAFAGTPDEFDRKDGWAEGMDWGVWQDVKRAEAPFLDGLSLALVWIALLAWLFGQAVSAGVLASAAEDAGLPATKPPEGAPSGRVARFLSGAGRWFFPNLRTSLVFLFLTMLVARRLIFETWGGISGDLESKADTQAAAWFGARWREGTFLVVFLVLRAAADLGRAHLIVRGRRSAFLSFFRGLGTLARHPLKAGGLALLVGVPEMLLLYPLVAASSRMPAASTGHLIGAFLLLEAAVLVRWAARATLLAGNVRLLQR